MLEALGQVQRGRGVLPKTRAAAAHLSLILLKMNISYDDSNDLHQHRAGADDYWLEMMRDDDNSSHSLTLND